MTLIYSGKHRQGLCFENRQYATIVNNANLIIQNCKIESSEFGIILNNGSTLTKENCAFSAPKPVFDVTKNNTNNNKNNSQ